MHILKRAMIRVSDGVSLMWRRALSYRKREWDFSDYPVTIRAQAPSPALPPRFTQHLYRAFIVGWLVDAGGDSKQEALSNLEREFYRRKQILLDSGEPCPRPGKRVPLKLASQVRVDKHADLAEDFKKRVLFQVLGVEDVWISDDSSLWNFHFDETNDALCAKVKEVYGVDVSDIESEMLPVIFDRIAAKRNAE